MRAKEIFRRLGEFRKPDPRKEIIKARGEVVQAMMEDLLGEALSDVVITLNREQSDRVFPRAVDAGNLLVHITRWGPGVVCHLDRSTGSVVTFQLIDGDIQLRNSTPKEKPGPFDLGYVHRNLGRTFSDKTDRKIQALAFGEKIVNDLILIRAESPDSFHYR